MAAERRSAKPTSCCFSASLAHYISDAHVPLHGVINYDGQLSGQNGVHNRWETTMFERYRDRLTIAPKPIPPITNPRDFVFDRVLEDAQLVPGAAQVRSRRHRHARRL